MYKELVESIESNLRRFVEVPELEDYDSDGVYNTEDVKYSIERSITITLKPILIVRVYFGSSAYVFRGEWEVILARLKELWVND